MMLFSKCLRVVAAVAFTMTGAAEAARETSMMGDWQASWIWAAREKPVTYNDTIEARRTVELPALDRATLRITADTSYRLFINGKWVCDGPGRSWPAHYQYDVVDALPHLRQGTNEIRVIAKFFGIGTFHQIPQEPGLLAQLDASPKGGGSVLTIGTDATWEVRNAGAWAQYAPKQSVQMGPYEIYDARLVDTGDFAPAVVRHAALGGPWKELSPRDCPPLTRIPFAPKALEAGVVARPEGRTFVFPTAYWVYDGVVHANNKVQVTGQFATVLDMAEAGTLEVDADGNAVRVDGAEARRNVFKLDKGRHFLAVVLTEGFGHWRHDTELALKASVPVTLRNPVNGSDETPWCFSPFEGTKYAVSDMEWSLLGDEGRKDVESRLSGIVQDHLKNAVTEAGWRERLAPSARIVGADETTEAVNRLFQERKPLPDVKARVEGMEALLAGTGPAVVHPCPDGDVELLFDLGEQNVGYFQFELEAEAGLAVDIAGVEYITPSGKVQHTERYRNSMRYICGEGENAFTSLMRRSGRHLFVTLRGQTRPATIKGFRLIESTYPVEPVGSFASSDPRLNKIWEISERTLKLCMEDTFTDCPLYEQTLWVGDARNEALFAYTAFGANDIAQRCIRLAAYSLDEYPMVQSQVPSTWGVILPAWSFQWGLMVWDNYLHSGDKEFLAWAYPYVVKNLKGATQYTDSRGLFSAPFWNMFDWSGIDDGHWTVTHNSLFAVGAADAALKCAEVLGDTEHVEWLRAYRDQLSGALAALWDKERGWYPDSVSGNGVLSKKTCMHTGFLGLLFDQIPAESRADVLQKLLNPPEGMTPVGAPFAIMYLFDALEKEGVADAIIEAIYRDYQPMLDLGATTVWETFARGTTGRDGFPTRSHTHAWSSAPIQFLNRIVLGIIPEAPAGAAYRISPRLNGLGWAEGASAGIRGPVRVSWKRNGNVLDVTAAAPEGTALRFERNDSHEGLEIRFNGETIQPGG
ncbi:MAG: family 78 glycoside hydrolase catalytic domain [Candidatus Hydrogenedens sp.]|nr:family 78 glycoside hydrolase catalytic domain [Candidatus Hydrogenedentota bacterium]NLF56660.1 family 78 glycoside hydrolase catalytic domain [Candidatus Hydrogenedens sp.]